MARGELEFRGAPRKGLVDELMARFARVREEKRPFLLVLEAESGWGKTRLVHEFYRRLAAEQQPEPGYWPGSIIGALPEFEHTDMEAPSVRRKRIYPREVHPPKAARPAWFWWGISCAERNGSPLSSLDQDFRQVLDHRDALVRMLPMSSRITKMLKGKDFWETLAQEAVGAAVPGVGLLVFGARNLRSGSVGSSRAGATSAIDLADELAENIGTFAKTGVPVIIAIEDLQLADAALVELVVQVVEDRVGPVLVIATAVSGEMKNSNAERLEQDVSVSLRETWDLDASTGHLDLEDRVGLVRELLATAGEREAVALARRYEIPYILELACDDRRVRDAVAAGTLSLRDIERLPRRVGDFWRDQFDRLSEDVQEAFMLAVLSAPGSITKELPGDAVRVWDRELPAAALEGLPWATEAKEALQMRLDVEGSTRAWIRSIGEWLRVCHEPGRFDLVQQIAEDRFGESVQQRSFWQRLHQSVPDFTEGFDAERQRIIAQVLVALALEEVVEWSPRAIAAADLLIDEALAAFDMNSLALVETLGRAVSDDDASRAVRRLEKVAQALERRGKSVEAASTLREALEKAEGIAGHDPLPGLGLREALSHLLLRAGRFLEARPEFDAALEQCALALGPSHERAFALRRGLAVALVSAGETNTAVDVFEALVADRVKLDGEDAPATLAERSTMLSWLAQTDRHGEAVAGARELVADCESALGVAHQTTLDALHALTHCLAESRLFEDAIGVMNSIISRLTELHDEDDSVVLNARMQAAVIRGRAGDFVGAADETMRRVDALTSTLGPEHPQTLRARSAQLSWLRDTDRRPEAISELRELVDECIGLLGEGHSTTRAASRQLAVAFRDEGLFGDGVRALRRVLDPNDLGARSLLAELQGLAGNVDEATAEFTRLVEEQERICGADSQQALKQRRWQVGWIFRAGETEAALEAGRALVEDYERILGPNLQDTLDARADFAGMLHVAHSAEDAVAVATQILERQMARPDADPIELLGFRADLADARRRVGDVVGALGDLEQLVRDRTALQGPTDQRTLRQRMVLMDALCKFDHLEAAIEGSLALVGDCLDALGEFHFVTREALDVLANAYARAGRFEEEVSIRQGMADRVISSRGRAHPDALLARQMLAFAHERAGRTMAAAEELLDVVATLSNSRGPRHAETVSARRAMLVWLRGLPPDMEVREASHLLLAEAEMALDADDPLTLSIRALLHDLPA